MDEQQTTDLMAETLREGLSCLRGRPVAVRAVERAYCPRSSSFRAERLRVLLDGGECLPVFFKDLDPRHQLDDASAVRGGGLGPSRRELLMYRQVLSRQGLGTPDLYAWRWDPEGGAFWLFLEDAGGSRLTWDPDFDLWLAAARWAARFHALAGRLPAGQSDFLVPYDRSHYREPVERIERKLPDLDPARRPAVRRALDRYAGLIDAIGALPQGVIHGEFFGRNIVVRAGCPDRPLAVIDWESSAVGPSYLDLVSLACGWKPPQKQALWRAYFEQYQADTGLRLDWEGFCRDLARLALYHALRWLAWRPDWNFSMARWMRELEQAMADTS